MTSEELKLVARHFFEEVWNQGSPTAIEELSAPDIVAYDAGQPEPVRGIEAEKERVRQYRSAFPDVHFTVKDQIAEGDKVLSRWEVHATHQGALLGIPPTGKSFTVSGMTVDQIANGKIIQSWINWDTLGLMQQIGVIPKLGQGGLMLRLFLLLRRLRR